MGLRPDHGAHGQAAGLKGQGGAGPPSVAVGLSLQHQVGEVLHQVGAQFLDGVVFLVEGPEHADVRALAACMRSEEHTSELQSQSNLVCRLLLEKKKKKK